jgi:penicillin-binding protein 1A
VSTIRKRLAFLDVPHIPRDMSIALGNLGLSPLKMAQIFSVFANHGHMIEPRLISKVISKEGAVIYETRPKEIANFTTPEQAYLMTDILMDVIKRGTGKNARVKGLELAGKTGTTNNGVDAWFCGYSPTIEVISWFGRDDNKPIGKKATGGALAAPAFAYYFKKLLEIKPDLKRTFDIPEGVYRGEYKGKSELYTETSPLPEDKNKVATEEENSSDIMDIWDSDTQVQYADDVSDISPDEESPFAETINIDDDVINEGPVDDDDPLHPRRTEPVVPASKDSGTLF